MKVIIAGITDSGIYRARRSLIELLISQGHSVVVIAPYTGVAEKLEALGAKYYNLKVDRHGLNPIKELGVFCFFRGILKKEKPNIVFSFTIKPNLYLGLSCRMLNIPCVMNITGLGEGLMHEGRTKQMLLKVYPLATKKAVCIFFQNTFNRQFFIDHKLADPKIFRMLPGSGVDVTNFKPMEYPNEDSGIRFLFVSRIVKDKGIDELVSAIKEIKSRHNNVEFHFVGGCADEYKESLEKWKSDGLIVYHGRVAPEEMKNFYKMTHCLIHPSYHEGMANVILESAACGRPCMASDINGCKEGIDDGKTGFVFKVKSSAAIVERIEAFLALSHDEKIAMGLAGRRKMEKEFDRTIVTNAYMDAFKEFAR